VRVLSTLLFLARRTGQVTVSSLVAGHPAPLGGGRSAHQFGAAVEISSLGGSPVAFEQQSGGVVDRTIRALLSLPDEVRPKHVTSLLDLGPSTFSLADFRDHIQISFDPTIRSAPDQLHMLWQLAGSRYGVPWQVLAAINKIETNYGQNMGPSSAGAIGWMQFMPSTWRQWGVDANGDGRADPTNPADAIFSAARYLAAAGAGTNLRRAIYAYNHADWYVNDVLQLAGSYS
jgi:membrane-bound lytic murein transglycosylase B